MRKDHRPYFLKRAFTRFQDAYTRRFIRPQLDALGVGAMCVHPWNIKIFGAPVTIGQHVNILTTSDKKVRLTVWPEKPGMGKIAIGDFCLVCPGVRISSANEIVIADNCMMAGSSFITDADWHGTYDRVQTIGETAPVYIRDNVWLGDCTTVCKGVTIGENSIIGAGSVVVRDVPPNVIAAGNPARVVRELDPERRLVKRAAWFADIKQLNRDIQRLDHENLAGNSLIYWIKTVFAPGRND
ncbi:MAG: acyltransferase [Desulfosalsimonas sp.]|uniref:acyltransferase n=1 Tax=Desulfosalsimonas sp. TaxID=3073848 RepID=UPI0039705A75